MISGKILCSDAFLALPCAAQALYVQLTLKADDDGFVNNPQQVRLSAGAKQRDLRILIERRFLMELEGGIVLIKHWRVANSLRKDRCKPPQYPALAAKIYIRENLVYSDRPEEGSVCLLEYKKGDAGCPTVAKPATVDSPNRTEKKRKEQKRTEEKGAEAFGAGAAQGPPGIGEEREKEKKRGEEQPRKEGKPGREEQEDFARLYGAYPPERRGNPGEAQRAFENQAFSKKELIQARQNLEYWKRSRQWSKAGGQYIPYFVNFLSRGLWRQIPREEGSLLPSGVLGEAELENIRRTIAEGGEGFGKTDSL